MHREKAAGRDCEAGHMRMMKGSEEAEVAMGAVVLVIAFGMVFGTMVMKFTDYSAVTTTGQNEMTAIAEAHRSVHCLQMLYFSAEQLSDAGVLARCASSHDICVRDLETGRRSGGCGGRGEWSHTIYFTLRSGNDIHMGGLSVRV